MKKRKIIIAFLFDIIEIHIPTLCIFITFIAFVCQVFSRRILGHQWFWTYETATLSFVFCIFFGSGYAARNHTHVTFESLYELLPKKIHKYADLLITLLGLIVFGLMLEPCWTSIWAQSLRKTDTLRIPMVIAMMPYFIFVLTTLIHLLTDLVRQIKVIIDSFKGGKKS